MDHDQNLGFRVARNDEKGGGIYEVTQKDLNAEARPPLKTKIADMKKYDVVLLGYPTWWATLPMPVMTFLENYDFSGKTVISFSSHGGITSMQTMLEQMNDFHRLGERSRTVHALGWVRPFDKLRDPSTSHVLRSGILG